MNSRIEPKDLLMKLYHAPTSPYVRKVMVVLHETGLLDQVEIHSVATTPVSPSADLQAANPLAKIPALERADGGTLYVWSLNRLFRFNRNRLIGGFDFRAACGLCQL